MTTDELKSVSVTKTVDARGTACPGPLLEAKKAMGTINGGEILEVLSADEGSKRDIPLWAQKKELEYLGTIDEPGYFRIFIRK
jgi:tRNA 2-thiouridine synthesizing protein A